MLPWTQSTFTPRSFARRSALRRPATEISTPLTSKPWAAKKTLSRPSPHPRSSTRAPGGKSAASCLAKAEGSVPQMFSCGLRPCSRAHGLRVMSGATRWRSQRSRPNARLDGRGARETGQRYTRRELSSPASLYRQTLSKPYAPGWTLSSRRNVGYWVNFVTRSPATLKVARSRSPNFPDPLASPPAQLARRSTPRVAGSLVPRLARNLPQYRAQIDHLPNLGGATAVGFQVQWPV